MSDPRTKAELLAALERAERERVDWENTARVESDGLMKWHARAEIAERALAEAYQRVEEALSDLERAGSDPAPLRVVRFALRPSTRDSL